VADGLPGFVRVASPKPAEPDRAGIPGWVATLDPGYFAWVMASGIISVGAALLGQRILSDVALWVTGTAFVVLVVAYAARFIAFPGEARASLGQPGTAMAFFTVVAGTDVVGIRLLMAGHPLVGLILGAVAGSVWVVLSYGLPWSIVAGAQHPVLGDVNGTWLIWVVATQSVSIMAAGLATASPWHGLRPLLPDIAVALWGVGVMLYLVLIVIIFLRLLLVAITPAEMGPAYWIAMGATAISVRAAAGILDIHDPSAVALQQGMRPFLIGLSVMLWAFGTWWIPLLVLFGLWRHVLRRYPLSYEPRLWSVVFPLGMYTVASYTLGSAEPGLGFMVDVARVWLWVGAAAWVATLGLMLAHHGRVLARTKK
jgi:tellurite resistance protein TehA-like permease